MGDIRQRLSKRYPEIDLFDSHQAAKDAMKAWHKQLAKKPSFYLVLVGYTFGVGGCVAAILTWVHRWVAVPPGMYGGILGGITGGSGTVAMAWFWRRRVRRFLRERLLALGVPICLKCGYDLRGQTTPRCPECGTPFDSALVSP